MNLTVEDWILWIGGFVGVVTLLALLLWRGGAKVFPWLAASLAYEAIQTAVLFLIHIKGTYTTYFWAFWYGQIPENLFVLTIIVNLAYVLLRPNGFWRSRTREIFYAGFSVAVVAAVVLTWISEPHSPVAMVRVIIRTKLFCAILKTELAAAMILAGLLRGCAWIRWTKGLAMGMLLQFPVEFAVEVAHTYFGQNSFYYVLVRITGYAEMAALCCWIITFARKKEVTEPLYDFGHSPTAIFR